MKTYASFLRLWAALLTTVCFVLQAGELPVVAIRATRAVTAEPLPGGVVPPGLLLVTRSGPVANELKVWLRHAGTATAGKDYEPLPGEVTIPPGKEAVELRVLALADDLVEGEESVVATVYLPVFDCPNQDCAPYRISPEAAAARVKIEDQDRASGAPLISISAVDPEASEIPPMLPASDSAKFRLDRTGDPEAELTVILSVRGTAEAGVDYQALGRSAVFRAGERTTDLYVVVLDDRLVEGDESVVVKVEPDPSLGPIERYRVDPARSVAKAIIHDNETALEGPRLEITLPKDGAQLSAGKVVRIEALAVDPQGFIARLEYFANGTKIGESSVGWPECVGCEPQPGDPAKHVFEWEDVPLGRHELMAKATHRLVFRPHYQEQPLDPPLVSSPVHFVVGNVPPAGRFSIVATRPVAEESSFPYRRLPLIGEFTISRKGDLSLPASVFVHYEGEAENGVDCERLPGHVTGYSPE